ncbi:MAG: hypothetical protein JSS09_05330 [Verrucomicrobia bacterium]|nr:hypothetical protein [Verrucomicrobiota bacterium]
MNKIKELDFINFSKKPIFEDAETAIDKLIQKKLETLFYSFQSQQSSKTFTYTSVTSLEDRKAYEIIKNILERRGYEKVLIQETPSTGSLSRWEGYSDYSPGKTIFSMLNPNYLKNLPSLVSSHVKAMEENSKSSLDQILYCELPYEEELAYQLKESLEKEGFKSVKLEFFKKNDYSYIKLSCLNPNFETNIRNVYIEKIKEKIKTPNSLTRMFSETFQNAKSLHVEPIQKMLRQEGFQKIEVKYIPGTYHEMMGYSSSTPPAISISCFNPDPVNLKGVILSHVDKMKEESKNSFYRTLSSMLPYDPELAEKLKESLIKEGFKNIRLQYPSKNNDRSHIFISFSNPNLEINLNRLAFSYVQKVKESIQNSTNFNKTFTCVFDCQSDFEIAKTTLEALKKEGFQEVEVNYTPEIPGSYYQGMGGRYIEGTPSKISISFLNPIPLMYNITSY